LPAALTFAVISGGLVIAALGALSLLTVAAGAGLGGIAWRPVVLGAGSGLLMATSSAVAVQSVPNPFAGMAGAGNNAIRRLGAALGPAVLGALVNARTSTNPSARSTSRLPCWPPSSRPPP
jgi:hypothetical protein